MKKTEAFLQNKNIRPTAMRILTYQALVAHQTALSLNDLEVNLETADRTTLYRTIKTFEEQGIVHAIEDGTGITKYALCPAYCNAKKHKDLHLHFHCKVCEETQCLTDYAIPQISLPEKYTVENIHLTIKGVCQKCNKA